jgi:DNA helicase II / ATP-dependent DNA helicase PcrA
MSTETAGATADDGHLEGLTPAQLEAVLHRDGAIRVIAGAGSGKTRVITRRIAHLLRSGVDGRRILALTFTKKAAGEMRHRVEQLAPESKVHLGTFHSFASTVLRRECQRLNLHRDFGICDQDDQRELVEECLEKMGVAYEAKRKAGDTTSLTPKGVAGDISRWKSRMANPGRLPLVAKRGEQLTARVFQRYQWELRRRNMLDYDDLLNLLATALQQDEHLRRSLDDKYRYILVDEFQDTNAAQYAILRLLTRDYNNIMIVGDPDQCFPTGTLVNTPTGPVRIEDLRDGASVVSACGWGETTNAVVEKVMEKHYEGTLIRLTLADGTKLSGTPQHAMFGRLTTDPDRHYVYLMYRKGYGYRIGTTRGVRMGDKIRKNGIEVRCLQEHADCMWVIQVCDNSADARLYEQFFSVQFGIPTMVFFAAGRTGMAVGQEHIDCLFQWIDTERNAKRLLESLQLDIRHPHHHAGGSVSRNVSRRKVHMTMFGDSRIGRDDDGCRWRKHIVQLNTSGDELKERLAKDGHAVRAGKRADWRVSKLLTDYDAAEAYMDTFGCYPEFAQCRQAKMTSVGLFNFTPMGNMLPGMEVPVVRDNKVVPMLVTHVEREEYSGKVYDLSVKHVRNYAANGVVVHNSIYKFRGADISNIMGFRRDYRDCREIVLDRNYRSTPQVIEAANWSIRNNDHRVEKTLVADRPHGVPVRVREVRSDVAEGNWIAEDIRFAVDKGADYRDHAILLRQRRLRTKIEEGLMRHGIPYKLYGIAGFFDSKVVRDLLAYLRLLVRPDDLFAFLRVINTPSRGLGQVAIDKIRDWAEANVVTPLDACRQADRIRGLPAKAAESAKRFAGLLDELGSAGGRVADVVRSAAERSGYRQMLLGGLEGNDEAAEKLERLDRLVEYGEWFTEEKPEEGLREFLEWAALSGDQEAEGAESDQIDRVAVMTLHAAKGLEFPTVYMPAMEQGILPSRQALMGGDDEDETGGDMEEERRIFFVGVTRAMDRLVLTRAYYRLGKDQRPEMTARSIFLGELPRTIEFESEMDR